MKTRLISLESTGSTNDYLKALAREGAEAGTCVTAKRQESGKGRLGRSFFSPEGGLYISYLLRPQCAPEKIPEITKWAASAVINCLDALGIRADIKYVNDILLNGKKLAGILTEGSSSDGKTDFAVIGIGLNVDQRTFPDELKEIATSLYLETGNSFEMELVTSRLISELEKLADSFPEKEEEYMEIYRGRCIYESYPDRQF